MGVKISAASLFLVLAANILQSGYGATYTVGDSTGWGIPNNNAEFYDNWADNKNFVIGDVLVFNFTSAHNVAEVTEAAYDACNTANTISTVTNAPARITLNRTGEHYFVCSVPGHCSAGQKLNVEVRNGNRTTTDQAPERLLELQAPHRLELQVLPGPAQLHPLLLLCPLSSSCPLP